MALRLIYFAGRARAEISRLILAFGALDYTDVRLSDVHVLIELLV